MMVEGTTLQTLQPHQHSREGSLPVHLGLRELRRKSDCLSSSQHLFLRRDPLHTELSPLDCSDRNDKLHE